MPSKDEIIVAMEKLAIKLSMCHKNSETALFVDRELEVLKTCDGLAFHNKLQYFFNTAPVIKLSDSISFSESEKTFWDAVFEYKQLGNYDWIASE
ncbi:hypothetical protein DB330_13870 [Lacticaseibacillus casei]|uniref:Uncharacterized protein n=1 Tax=Lacticaseibacillus casei DSM 20011 = JCM 1134 = ATCC 393 TaxID=1423732 RepID=A0AAD1ETG1_LACCA|nr:hypothetical protein [Lacticaseibacillus casei]MBI6598901.1 hypothetical protein [Lacticaseibacillus casei]MCK2082242.1 hypothetical protein [Lacticaseibacillus casei]MED7631945.1 hypothetical protein [Lacticaseibacillus casei]NIG81820.1 hypothetical protein [Lacticaseibacillus casei]PTU90388.1 hypothetical protein DB330_13870 [Lacticaseibacillus casei]